MSQGRSRVERGITWDWDHGHYDPVPLLTLAHQRVKDHGRFCRDKLEQDHPIPANSVTEIAELMGVQSRMIHRWQAGHRVTPIQADRACTALGLHPNMVWPEWDHDSMELWTDDDHQEVNNHGRGQGPVPAGTAGCAG